MSQEHEELVAVDEVNRELENLTISQPLQSANCEINNEEDMISTENSMQITNSEKEAKKAEKKAKKQKRKEKKEEKRTLKMETQGKLTNLSITVANEKSTARSPPKASTSKTAKKSEDDKLREQLKRLQQGTINSNSIVIKNNKKLPVTDVPAKNHVLQQKNHEEVMILNHQIQSRIANQIKPRLLDIISNQAKPIKSKKNGFVEKRSHLAKVSNEPVEIKKTRISDTVEIYRYSFAQIYQLQMFGTWEIVPRLLQLNICKTRLSDGEKLVLSLINLSDQERQSIILDQAEKMRFVQKKSHNNFDFIPMNFHEKQREHLPSVSSNKTDQVDHIERLRLIAKNDDELNDLIYQHEFINLFESELQNQDLQDQSHANIVQHLLDNNKAYIVEGEIRVNQKNNQEAYVSHRKGMKDICVSKLILRKHSFHGDFVKVLVKQNSGDDEEMRSDDIHNRSVDSENADSDLNEVIQMDERTPENRNFGCVLEITEKRHSRRVIGTFAPFLNIKKNRKHLMVNVRDPKVPNVRVNIRTGLPTDVELNEKLLLTVEIIGWSYDQPQGRVTSIIGNKGQLKTENAAILLQNNLDPKPFSQSIIDQLPDDPYDIPAKEFAYRADLRKKCIFSIDPESARDLDDALSCEVLPNGNLEIGVHISDVSYFVSENSELDLIVKDMATTIYLVDAVYHMLPEKLCFLCSLLPGSDKIAYSVFFEMNPDTAEIYNKRFTRSIINSCAKLSYDHAQMVIEKSDRNWSELEDEFPPILNGFTITDVAEVILKLQKIALILREKRKENGAIHLDRPKLAFKFESDDQRMEAPIDFFKYPIRESNKLIEEFMLLANISVATFIKEKFPEISLLRHHAAPKENGLKKLVKTLTKHGISLDTSSSKAMSKSIEDIVANAKHPSAMNAVLNDLASRTMTRANYFCSGFSEKPEDFWHFALSIPMYTHFTSPIRRYADILVHRVLNAALNYEEPPISTPEEVQMMASVCNAQKYAAKLAGDDSSNLYFMHFIQTLRCKTMTAAVLGIFDYNLEIVLIDSAHAIKVFYKNLQQSDPDIVIKTFTDQSPPYISVHQMSKTNSNMKRSLKLEFGSEILVQVEVIKEKLVVNKIFFN